MGETFRLGRVAGVSVGAHWSVAVVAWLVAFSIAVRVLPAEVPGRSAVAYWLAGGIAAVLFLASLLAHELSHALVARRNGVEVEGITLWALGGVARLRGEARTAGADFRIAAVGPAVSGLLGAGFLGLAVGLSGLGVSGLPVAVTAWLGGINVLLGVFNLIPGAPLDGGRVLRAVVWSRTGDRGRATMTASNAGRIVGFALIGVGALQLLAGADFGGLWLALIGLFVIGAAGAERSYARARVALAGLRARDVMILQPTVLPAWWTLAQVADQFALAGRQPAFPVVDADARVLGVLSTAALKGPRAHPGGTAGQLATPLAEVPVVGLDDPADRLLELLGSRGPDSCALVFDTGRLVGLVSLADLERIASRGLSRRR